MLPSAEHGSLLIQGLQYAMSYRAIYHFKLTHLHMRSATRELQSDRRSQFYTATNPGKQCLKPSCPTKSSVCFSLRVLTSLAQRVNISLLISIVHDSKKKNSWNSMTFPSILARFPLSCPKVFPQITVVSDAMAMPIAMTHGRVGSPQCGDAWTAAWPTGSCCDDHGKMIWTY